MLPKTRLQSEGATSLDEGSLTSTFTSSLSLSMDPDGPRGPTTSRWDVRPEIMSDHCSRLLVYFRKKSSILFCSLRFISFSFVVSMICFYFMFIYRRIRLRKSHVLAENVTKTRQMDSIILKKIKDINYFMMILRFSVDLYL